MDIELLQAFHEGSAWHGPVVTWSGNIKTTVRLAGGETTVMPVQAVFTCPGCYNLTAVRVTTYAPNEQQLTCATQYYIRVEHDPTVV